MPTDAVLDHVDAADPVGAGRSFSAAISSASGSSSPSSETGRPCSKPIDDLLRRGRGRRARRSARTRSSGGAAHGSSSIPASIARPNRFSSIENGELRLGLDRDAALPPRTRSPRRASRRGRAAARSPARPGTFALNASSKRTWSLPLPVQPCTTASAPSSRAISRDRLARSPAARAPRRAGTCPRRARSPSAPSRRPARSRTRPCGRARMTSSAPAARPRAIAGSKSSVLADVDEHGDDLVEAVVLLQPGDGAARVEPAASRRGQRSCITRLLRVVGELARELRRP